MTVPPYFKQVGFYNCSLAVLRMVLAQHQIILVENTLQDRVISDYGKDYKSLWNPTIAKMACEYGIQTTLYASWPLLKPNILPVAIVEYRKSPETFSARKYENIHDKDTEPIPLPLSYKEMFLAIEKGCKTVYGKLTKNLIQEHLDNGDLIMISIKNNRLYPGKSNTSHSILLYGYKVDMVYYHDPKWGERLQASFEKLEEAMQRVRVGIVFTV